MNSLRENNDHVWKTAYRCSDSSLWEYLEHIATHSVRSSVWLSTRNNIVESIIHYQVHRLIMDSNNTFRKIK